MKQATSWKAIVASLLIAGLMQSGYAADDDYFTEHQAYFDSDNWGSDEYGVFDEDFVWSTADPWYDDWNETDIVAWNNAEEAHWDVFGYDDADEWGLFDW